MKYFVASKLILIKNIFTTWFHKYATKFRFLKEFLLSRLVKKLGVLINDMLTSWFCEHTKFRNQYLVQLIEHPILRIPNILFHLLFEYFSR